MESLEGEGLSHSNERLEPTFKVLMMALMILAEVKKSIWY